MVLLNGLLDIGLKLLYVNTSPLKPTGLKYSKVSILQCLHQASTIPSPNSRLRRVGASADLAADLAHAAARTWTLPWFAQKSIFFVQIHSCIYFELLGTSSAPVSRFTFCEFSAVLFIIFSEKLELIILTGHYPSF